MSYPEARERYHTLRSKTIEESLMIPNSSQIRERIQKPRTHSEVAEVCHGSRNKRFKIMHNVRSYSMFRVTRNPLVQMSEYQCNKCVPEQVVAFGQRDIDGITVYALKGLVTGKIYETDFMDSVVSQVSADAASYFNGDIVLQQSFQFQKKYDGI